MAHIRGSYSAPPRGSAISGGYVGKREHSAAVLRGEGLGILLVGERGEGRSHQALGAAAGDYQAGQASIQCLRTRTRFELSRNAIISIVSVELQQPCRRSGSGPWVPDSP